MAHVYKELAIGAMVWLALTTDSHVSRSQDAEPKECSEKTVISGVTPGFPAQQDVLLGYVPAVNRTAMRVHEWGIFSGLINNSGAPKWEDWDSKCEVRLTTLGCQNTQGQPPANGLRGLEFPVELIANYRRTNNLAPTAAYDLKRLDKDLSKGPVLASVRFNPEAACHILKNQLMNSAQLSSLLQGHLAHPADAGQATIPLFIERASIAVKLEWEFLEEEVTGNGGSTTYYLHLFDPVTLRMNNAAQGGSYAVAAADEARIKIVPDSRCEDRDYVGEPVPLSCFYSFPVSDLNLPSNDLVSQVGHHLLLGPGPHYVALVGVHITTKEIPDWTWATFYWSRRALDQTRNENKDRLPTIKTPWNHYSMMTTFDSEAPPDLVTGGPPIASNPYLEGKFNHGASSNCLFCHRLASFAASSTGRDIAAAGAPIYENGMRIVDHSSQSPFLNNSLGTDLLWSLGDLTGQQEQNFLQEFKHYLDEQLQLNARPKSHGVPRSRNKH